MKNLGELMKQAQAMQAKLQEAQARLAATEVEGSSGGGMVTVRLKGGGDLAGLDIDESLMAPGEGEILSDLIVAAHADARRKLEARQAELMREAAGPFAGLPGMPGVRMTRPAGFPDGRLRRPRDRAADRAAGQAAGPRPAAPARRAALTLLKRKEQLLEPLAEAMAAAAQAECRSAQVCGSARHPRPLRHLRRRRPATTALICVVEEVGALWAMERASAFRGRYHVLGGLLSALDGVSPRPCASPAWTARTHEPAVKEVILALPATVDGQTTAHCLADRLAGTACRHLVLRPRRPRRGRTRLAR